jgi:hypothetical protein
LPEVENQTDWDEVMQLLDEEVSGHNFRDDNTKT